MGCFVRRIILSLLALAILGTAFSTLFRFEIAYWKNRNIVDPSAQYYGIPPHLLASVIWQETRFRSGQRGKAGEIGLMQIMPASALEWAKAQKINPFRLDDMFDPTTNTMAGAWYLRRAMSRWKSKPDPIPYALAEYNAGASNAQRWDHAAKMAHIEFVDAITYPATRRYITDVIRRRDNFGKPWRHVNFR
jgi:soluble lytic murein transglycosylase